jgi:hypothetical protein
MKKLILRSLSLLFIPVFTIAFELDAQNKIEREYSISIEQVPKQALQKIEQLPLSKVNWIYEKSENSHSIEAKFKHNKHWYSIEFDTTGGFQDAEIEIDWNGLEESIKQTIEKSLERKTESFKVRKTQLQLKGEVDAVFKDLLYSNRWSDWITGYELVVNARVDGVYHQYEFIYDINGQMQRMQQIELRGTDNLEFE